MAAAASLVVRECPTVNCRQLVWGLNNWPRKNTHFEEKIDFWRRAGTAQVDADALQSGGRQRPRWPFANVLRWTADT